MKWWENCVVARLRLVNSKQTFFRKEEGYSNSACMRYGHGVTYRMRQHSRQQYYQ